MQAAPSCRLLCCWRRLLQQLASLVRHWRRPQYLHLCSQVTNHLGYFLHVGHIGHHVTGLYLLCHLHMRLRVRAAISVACSQQLKEHVLCQRLTGSSTRHTNKTLSPVSAVLLFAKNVQQGCVTSGKLRTAWLHACVSSNCRRAQRWLKLSTHT